MGQYLTLAVAVFCAAMCAPATAVVADADLKAVLARWDKDAHPDLRGVIVLRKGRSVAERYYNGETAATLHDIRSAGKSVTSLLVGIAIDRGKIRNVNVPLARYWPQARTSPIGDVALADILTMRSGLAAFDDDPTSPGHEDRLDASPDPLGFILTLPRAAPPGSIYRYNSVTAAIAGIVVAKATGQPMADFARSNLFEPLGIRRWRWAADTAGYTKGQGNLSLTLRDFAAIGEMVRRNGMYAGRRVVSAGWLRQSLEPKVTISGTDPYADGYGYFWYAKTQTIGGRAIAVSFASGNGGNKLYVVPSLDMVVAITSSAYGHGYGQRRSEDILNAILSSEVGGSAPSP